VRLPQAQSQRGQMLEQINSIRRISYTGRWRLAFYLCNRCHYFDITTEEGTKGG